MMELFHGSNVIVDKPLVNVGRQELDFGPGFYITQYKDQAVRWAKRVCVIRRSDTPYVSKYTFNEDIIPSDIKRITFDMYDIQWLDFIVASRKGQKPWEEYDIIEGGVANDQVIDTVEDYYAGRITADQAIGQLKFAKPSHQVCISNQEIIEKCLFFESAELIK